MVEVSVSGAFLGMALGAVAWLIGLVLAEWWWDRFG